MINEDELIDVKENNLIKLDYNLLSILLFDNTTKRNIIWATDNYSSKGQGYSFSDEITIEKITGHFGQVIKPRIKKSKVEQLKRSKDMAEVFTPSWICNIQNNLVDEEWFSSKNIFNVVTESGEWITNKEPIQFLNKSWEEYVESLRLEVSCGEAPYLVSRYDATNGNVMDVINRIGLLDRKLRIVNENVTDENEWFEWCKIAYKNVYGYEWQGDSLLIARENLLYTFIDNYYYKFNKYPSNEYLIEIAKIISWNIFQMDGLRFVIPNSCKNKDIVNLTLFGEEVIKTKCQGCLKNNRNIHNGIYVKIMNWNTNRQTKFINVLNKK